MLLKRVITAAIGIPVLIACIQWGGTLVFLAIILLVAGAGLNELLRASLPDETAGERLMGICLGLVILVSVFLEAQVFLATVSGNYYVAAAGCAFSIFILFLHILFTASDMAMALRRMSCRLLGIFYIGLLFSYMILIRSGVQGSSLVLLLLFVTWLGDAGAYFVGTLLGKHPLCPAISPKKTVEGAIGGLVFGILAAVVCNMLLLNGTSITFGIIAGAGINIMNQLGDLSESVIKRAFGLKDSGGMFPGHGGVLDRIDSLLFAAPYLFYCSMVLLPV